ncbi:MAG: DUF4082 domain-containing protein [Cellulomonas sp.]|uniref:DUF4082 domain-containing protein n=1 Tax=Cellulomonas sp. TaxID=40001 RepID=UPI00180C06D8|nr:DUF4082 domain-containing protein [Cellulomonas sp.]NMM30784.1 DUF4082 domain-containing protein [Cellulomonas sp.]
MSISARRVSRRPVAIGAALALAVSSLVAGFASPASAADPCAVGGNPIVCENSKTGTDPSVWDISGAGDASIQGFATDISVNVGSTIGFKVDTSAMAYTIDIYRTGWYGGLGARFITSVPVTATLPQAQPQCLTDLTTELYDCGNWGISASWAVPATAVSGVYIAKLRRADLGDASHITFIVRNDASHSDVVFQTSDPSWQAYNTYGGSDFYQGAANGRAYKISYNRPFATRNGATSRDFYFSSEYAMVRFLERNGYDVSYQAGVDTDRFGSLLTNHKVFMSLGHDEYWSGGQRANVEAARDAGVNLAFFSGNEIYWKTRYENASSGTATPYRTLVSYKETWSNAKIDPSTEWTGTWRDPRFAPTTAGAGRPENGLSGTLYMSNNSDLPVTVSAEEGKLRLWRNTSLTSLAVGTTTALAAHTIGYESDEDLDNGARPAGLVHLSTTVGAVPQYLQDFGSVVLPGTTTHHLTLYRAASGALVFSAGSIQWAWGLDQTHDGAGAAADPRMQQATVNLLADMSAQPSTLMNGLGVATKSADTTAPTATITSPAAGAAIANGTSVTATGTASDIGGRVAGVEVSTDGGSTWHPATGTTAWTYTYVQHGQGTVPLKVRAVDDSANIGATPATVSLAVACPCSVYGSAVPAIGSANDTGAVELGLRFSATLDGYASGVRFFKGTANTGTHTGSLWSASGARLATVTFTGETATGWQSATFSAAVPLVAGTTYVVSYTAPSGGYAVQQNAFASAGLASAPLAVAGGFGVSPAGVYGAAGTFPGSSYQRSSYYVDLAFTTVDQTPMTISGQLPIAGATSVSTGTAVSVVLSKPAATGTAALTLKTSAGAAVAGTSAYAATTRTISFTPSAALASSTTYVATAAALDSLGQPIIGSATWSFTTAAPDQTSGATTISFYDESAVPAVLEVADYSAVTLGIRFASSASGKVSAVKFYKGPGNTGSHVGALWSATGTLLASATFTAESSMGWQTVTFATPVTIAKDTEYIASYRTTVGRYSATVNGFSGTGVQRAPLRTAPSSGSYSYANGFPGSSSSTSYMVDVVFTQDAVPLAITAQVPAPGSPGASTTGDISATFNVTLGTGATISVAAGSQAVSGTVGLSSDARTVTFHPAAALALSTAYTATVSGIVSTQGATMSPQSWSFTTASASGCPCTIFGSELPATLSVGDTANVELGVSFTPTANGVITGVRFYKGGTNLGTHTGTLWSSTGTQLRTVTFTGESASGWQTATFASPYEVMPGTTYVISYLAPSGGYATTSAYFTADRVVGPLTVPAAGNGRYRYGGGFPTSTWQSTNYFVDVVFNLAAPSLPVVSSVAPPNGATGISTSSTVSATLSKLPSSGTLVLALTGPAGAIAGTSAFDTTSLKVTFTPSAAMPAGSVIAAATTLDGTALGGGAWSFTTAAVAPTAVTLWADSEIPTYPSWNDPAAVQVGTRFTASVAGSVTAIRFYKGAANTGVHTVNLWDGAGNLVASAPSNAESASGWQTVPLPAAVALTPGATYVAAYYSTTGGYALTPGELTGVRTRTPLATLVTGGAYVYGTGFPAATSSAGYGVDLVFVPAG